MRILKQKGLELLRGVIDDLKRLKEDFERQELIFKRLTRPMLESWLDRLETAYIILRRTRS